MTITANAADAAGAVPRLRLLGPLQIRSYRLLWTGRAVSLIGDAFQLVVLPALVLDLTQRPSGLGGVLAAQAIPRAALLLAGGVATDRFRPRSVMVVANVLMACVVAGLLVPAASNSLALWHLYVYAVAFGAISGFAMPASLSMVPQLLPPDYVRAGNALAMMTGNLTRFVVPPLAGAVIAVAGSPAAFAVNATSFVVAAAVFSLLPSGGRVVATDVDRPGAARPPARGAAWWQHLRDGVVAAREDPVIWLVIQLSTVFWMGYAGALFVGLPALAKLVLRAGDQGVGLLYAASGAGALLGAFIAGGRGTLPRPGVAACVSVAVAGVLLVPAALAPTVWLSLPFLALSGAGGSACAVIFLSLVQTRVPERVRGRVISLLTLGTFGTAPLSYALAGVVADVFGPRGLLAGAGLLVALAGVVSLSQKGLRQIR